MASDLGCYPTKPDARSFKRPVTGTHPDYAFEVKDENDVYYPSPKAAVKAMHKYSYVKDDYEDLDGEEYEEKYEEKYEEEYETEEHPANKALVQASKYELDDDSDASATQKTATKTQAAVVHATHPSLDKLYPKKKKDELSDHPAYHTDIHVANAHKALETSKEPDEEPTKDEFDDANKTMHSIHVAQSLIKSKVPAKATNPHHYELKDAEAHLETAKTQVELLNAAQNDVKVKTKKVAEAYVKSAEASYDAHKAAAKYSAVEEAAKDGKASKKAVYKSKKDADEKAKVAHEAVAKAVDAEADQKKAEIKVSMYKAETEVEVEAAKKLAVVAAKTAKPEEASKTKKLAEDVKKTVEHLKVNDEKTIQVKADCDFMKNAVILGDLKSMPELDSEYSCVGFGSHISDGEMKVAAIKCKPLENGYCPTSYDESLCKIVALDVGGVKFKSLF